MKKLLGILSVGIVLASCEKKNTVAVNLGNNNDSTATVKEFVVDSVRVNDSVVVTKNLTSAFNKQVLVFPSITNKTVLDSIYSNAMVKSSTYDAAGLKTALEQDMKQSFDKTKQDIKEFSPSFKQTWDDTSAMKVVSNNDNLLTLKYTGSGYTGGAHGYYFENYKTFDLQTNKVISQNDIFKNPNDPAWSAILMNHFTNKDQKEMLLVDKIPLNNNFYFDNQKITFVYNQYEVAAYAAGVVPISLKFSEIKDKLKPEFLKRLKLE